MEAGRLGVLYFLDQWFMHLFTTFLMNTHCGRGTVLGSRDPAVNTYRVLALVELTFLGRKRVNKDMIGQEEGIHAKKKNETGSRDSRMTGLS